MKKKLHLSFCKELNGLLCACLYWWDWTVAIEGIELVEVDQ